jgi:hypothetical protein
MVDDLHNSRAQQTRINENQSYGMNHVMDQIKQNSAFNQPAWSNYYDSTLNPVNCPAASQYNQHLLQGASAMEANNISAHQRVIMSSTASDQASAMARQVDHSVADENQQRELHNKSGFENKPNSNKINSGSQLLNHLEASLHEMELRTLDYLQGQSKMQNQSTLKLGAMAASVENSSDVIIHHQAMQVSDGNAAAADEDQSAATNMTRNTAAEYPWRSAGMI